MNATEPWYIGERAENAAILLFSDFDVVVERSADARRHSNASVAGPDLHVVLKNDGATADFFVEVKGTKDTAKWITKDGVLRPEAQRSVLQASMKISRPVAVIVVNVKSMELYFGWVVAPGIRHNPAVDNSQKIAMEPATTDVVSKAFKTVMHNFDSADSAALKQ